MEREPLSKPMHQHAEIWYRVFLSVLVLALVGVALATTGASQSVVQITGLVMASMLGTFALICGVMVFYFGKLTTRVEEILDRVAGGDFIAHFTGYTSQELRAYAERERGALIKKVAWAVPLCVVLIYGGIALGVIMSMLEDGPLGLQAWITVGVASVLGLLTIVFVRRWILGSKERFLVKMQSREPELFVGHDVVWFCGWLAYFRTPFADLTDAKVIPGEPAVIELEIRSETGRHRGSSVVRVPIPKGREIEAQSAASRLLEGRR